MTAGMTGLEIVEITDDQGRIEGDPHATIPVPPVALNINANAAPNALEIRGNDAANTLTGLNSNNNTFIGHGGLDTITGGAGADLIRIEMPADNPDGFFLMDTFDEIHAGAIAEGNTLALIGKLVADNTVPGAMVWDLGSGPGQLVSVNGTPYLGIVDGVTSLDASLLGNASVTITGTGEANKLIGTALGDTFITATHFIAGDSIDGGLGLDTLQFTSAIIGDPLVLNGFVSNVEIIQIDPLDATNLQINATGYFLPGANNTKLGVTINANNLAADTITGGLGADTISVNVAQEDAINGGLLVEGNKLILTGVAAGAMSVDLNLSGDQISGGLLIQSGFSSVDASAVTGADVNVTGTAGNNIIGINVGQTSTVNAGNNSMGTDSDTMILGGAATGAVVIDLSSTVDQITSMNNSQVGFENVDASTMTGFGIDLTGSSGANSIIGTLQADTIDAGAGADTVVYDLSGGVDVIDAGNPAEGDRLVLKGDVVGVVTLDLAVAPGTDQLTKINAVAEGVIQSDFQHLDASGLGMFGIDARGNGLDNSITGSLFSDTIIGMHGSDRIALGGGKLGDDANDVVVYERPSDGVNSLSAVTSFDRITDFETGADKISFAADFHGGAFNLDDVDHNDSFKFVNNQKANFSTTDEAMLITSDKSGLTTEAMLAGGLAAVAGAISKMGVVAGMGDDGLILVQMAGGTVLVPIERTGIYYYQESDGTANSVKASELTLLGIVETKITESDVNFI